MRISINNQYYYTDSEDFQNALNDFKIEGLTEYIQELENQSNYEEKRFNSDMIAFESQIEEYRNMLSDTMDELNALRTSIIDSRRINKDSITNTLKRITKDINSNL